MPLQSSNYKDKSLSSFNFTRDNESNFSVASSNLEQHLNTKFRFFNSFKYERELKRALNPCYDILAHLFI